MSGTAIGDAAGLGTIEIKAMKDHGYSAEFAVGVTAASATLGPIIPPSLPFVIYAMFANVSVGALFLQLEHHFDTPDLWEAAIAEHNAVMSAIESHDAGGARAAMRRHMNAAARRFQRSWSASAPR